MNVRRASAFPLKETTRREHFPGDGAAGARTRRLFPLQQPLQIACDLVDFQATLQSLSDRQDGRSITLFDNFLATYIDQYLDPLLRAQWQSNHAELAAVDASLRFAKAELLIEMRYPRRVQDTIDDIQRRFKGRESLLIEYPIGKQGSLGDGLEILKDRKWKG